MSPPIRLLDPDSYRACRADLIALLVDAVAENAGVSFRPPLDPARAGEFWDRHARAATIFAAFDGERAVGTVSLVLDMPENQNHRAEIAKTIVARDCRRRGVARALMAQAIAHAQSLGRTLITLDTRTGDAAEPLYLALGFRRAGLVPDFARNATGIEETTSFLYLDLRAPTLPDFAPWRLRVAKDSDSPALIAHIERIWAEYPNCRMDLAEESDLAAVATNYAREGGSIWVVEDPAGALVASVAIVPCPQAPGGALLGRLYVAKSARRGRLASKLLAFAEASARARGTSFMELWTDTRFHEAHAFYEARGYTRQPGERALRDASDSYEYHYRKILV
jgi:GNAT superfamily N-acetyltransferase